VRDHEVGGLHRAVETALGELDAGHAADRKQEDEADSPQHRTS